MIVNVDLEAATVTLVEPGDFRGFHVAVAGGEVADPRLGELLAPHADLDGAHAWVRVDAVVELAGDAADDAWRSGFDGMVAYAREKGFLAPDGTAIRAHLEPA